VLSLDKVVRKVMFVSQFVYHRSGVYRQDLKKSQTKLLLDTVR
jgi:hypothetical protein